MNNRRHNACVRIFGKQCCWDSDLPCGAACQMIWRIWIFALALLVLVVAIADLIFIFVLLSRYWENTDIFVANRMTKLLMLTDGLIPVWLVISVSSAAMVAIWSIALILKPTNATPGGIVLYKLITSIITLSIFLGSIFQFVLYFLEWPDTAYRHEVYEWMLNDMVKENPPHLITQRWLDTQDFFKCCGINAPKDWISAISLKTTGSNDSNQSAKNMALPQSCCEKNTGTCLESSAWTDGCLDVQIDILKYYSNLNVVSSSFLYFLIDGLEGSVKLYFHKFPARNNYDYKPVEDDTRSESERKPDSPNEEEFQLISLGKSSQRIDGSASEIEENSWAAQRGFSGEDHSTKANTNQDKGKGQRQSKEELNETEFFDPDELTSLRNMSKVGKRDAVFLEENSNFTETEQDADELSKSSRRKFPKKRKQKSQETTFVGEVPSSGTTIKRTGSRISVAMKEDLGILFSDAEGFDVDEELGRLANKAWRIPDNGMVYKRVPASLNENFLATKTLSNDGNRFPNWHLWKGLPSQSLNDS